MQPPKSGMENRMRNGLTFKARSLNEMDINVDVVKQAEQNSMPITLYQEVKMVRILLLTL